MKALLTRNRNLLFNVSGVCFYTDKNFNLLKFTNENDFDYVKNQDPDLLEIEEGFKQKIFNIVKFRPKNVLYNKEKHIILKKAGIIEDILKNPKKPIEVLDWIFDPYFKLENSKLVNVNFSEFTYQPTYVHYKSRQWLVFGFNYSSEKEDKIYIVPSFGKEEDLKYLKIKDYL